MSFQDKLEQYSKIVNERLNNHLMPGKHFGPPERLSDAMRHAVIGSGKRIRPFIIMESAKIFGVNPHRSADVASAVECLHSYSLVHDDLPAMDDDDMRRGKPSCHKAFDEATAILAGDALQSLAFEILARPGSDADPAIRSQLVLEMATAAGWAGMAGGQMMDIELTNHPKKIKLALIQRIHAMKTGAVLEFSAVAGPIIAKAAEDHIHRFREYGKLVGLAFQAADDLLDVTGDSEHLGKRTGKDEISGKPSIVARAGLEKTQKYVNDLEQAAIDLIVPYGTAADDLIEATRFICRREK